MRSAALDMSRTGRAMRRATYAPNAMASASSTSSPPTPATIARRAARSALRVRASSRARSAAVICANPSRIWSTRRLPSAVVARDAGLDAARGGRAPITGCAYSAHVVGDLAADPHRVGALARLAGRQRHERGRLRADGPDAAAIRLRGRPGRA